MISEIVLLPDLSMMKDFFSEHREEILTDDFENALKEFIDARNIKDYADGLRVCLKLVRDSRNIGIDKAFKRFIADSSAE